MEFFFADPNIERLPPTMTRLLDLRAVPEPDGKRLRVALDLTPFEQRPYLELTLSDPEGNEAASASIVEPLGWKLELTLHVRKPAKGPGNYTLLASLSYPDLGEIDQRKITIELPPPAE